MDTHVVSYNKRATKNERKKERGAQEKERTWVSGLARAPPAYNQLAIATCTKLGQVKFFFSRSLSVFCALCVHGCSTCERVSYGVA